MSISDDSAIITLEVELVSTVTGDPTQTGEARGEGGGFLSGLDSEDDLKNIINEEINTNITDAIDEALQSEGIDMRELQKLSGSIKEWDAKTVGNITSLGKNPESFMENKFLSILSRAGPQGAIAVAIISAIAGSPAMVVAVIEALGAAKGSPLNQDFKFTQDEQMNLQFDRHMQFRKDTGDEVIITVLTKGFVVGDKDFNDNNLIDADIARTARIGLREASLGPANGV